MFWRLSFALEITETQAVLVSRIVDDDLGEVDHWPLPA